MTRKPKRDNPPALDYEATGAMIRKGRELGGRWLRMAQFTEFLETTGLRLAEALNVGRANLTHGGCLDFVGKGGKRRLVPVPPWLVEELPSEGLFFPISRTTARRWLHELARAAGVQFSRLFPHLFRATYATRLLDTGEPPANVANLTGHADLRTLMIYHRRAEGALTKTAEKAWMRP